MPSCWRRNSQQDSTFCPLVLLTRETAREWTVVQGIARFNKCPEERGGRGVAGMEMDSEAGVNLTRVVRAGCWKVTFKLRLEG